MFKLDCIVSVMNMANTKFLQNQFIERIQIALTSLLYRQKRFSLSSLCIPVLTMKLQRHPDIQESIEIEAQKPEVSLSLGINHAS